MLDTTNRVTDPSGLIAVADASFVIGISLCEQWDTLKMLVETLIIAEEVWEEVVERGEGKPGERELRQATFVDRRTVSNTSAVTMLMATLDKGEAETLVLATELDIMNVFVDDLRGRKVAQSLGLQAVGVAGFLIPGIASPNLGFDDVFSLIVADKEIHFPAPGWYFK